LIIWQWLTFLGHSVLHLYSATSRIPQRQRRFCVTERAGVQPIGRRLSLRPQTLTCDQTVIRSPGLPFNDSTPVIHVIWMDYYSLIDPRRMEGWV